MKSRNYILQSVKLALLALAALPLMAFQNVAAEDKAPEGENAVMCAKCKTVWVSRPVTSGGSKASITTFRQEKAMKCDECENAIVTFFKTGKLQHECKACGSELTHCKVHK